MARLPVVWLMGRTGPRSHSQVALVSASRHVRPRDRDRTTDRPSEFEVQISCGPAQQASASQSRIVKICAGKQLPLRKSRAVPNSHATARFGPSHPITQGCNLSFPFTIGRHRVLVIVLSALGLDRCDAAVLSSPDIVGAVITSKQ